MYSKLFVVVVAGVAAASMPALATTYTNYVLNGSFENDNGNPASLNNYFYDWTVSTGPGAVNPGNGPQIFVTDGKTKGEYGDVIASDNKNVHPYGTTGSGTHGVYFVDDVARETLTQSIFLPSGTYEVGFDLYPTLSGAANKNNSTLAVTIAGVTVTSGSVAKYTAGTWTHLAENATITDAGFYDVSFVFQGGAAPAKDVVIDSVYVMSPSTISGKGVVVPEPESLSLFGFGLAALILLRRRRPSSDG